MYFLIVLGPECSKVFVYEERKLSLVNLNVRLEGFGAHGKTEQPSKGDHPEEVQSSREQELTATYSRCHCC